MIHAPHELHLTDICVSLGSRYVELAASASDLSVADLEHLLWDRLLHRALAKSGKPILVDKTPGYALQWQRLREAWPEARFLFLLRDPADVLASAYAASPGRDPADTEFIVTSLIDGVDQARQELSGYEVRYEDLTTEPGRTITGVCGFLGVDFEPAMLTYAVPEVLAPGIGDFTDKIRSGRIQPSRRTGAVGSGAILERRRRWGYG